MGRVHLPARLVLAVRPVQRTAGKEESDAIGLVFSMFSGTCRCRTPVSPGGKAYPCFLMNSVQTCANKHATPCDAISHSDRTRQRSASTALAKGS